MNSEIIGYTILAITGIIYVGLILIGLSIPVLIALALIKYIFGG